MPKAKSDRLALLQATRANLDPIWGLTPGDRPPDRRPTNRSRSPPTTSACAHSLTPITDAAIDRRDPSRRRVGAARARRRSPPVRDRDRVPRRADRGRHRDRGRRPDHVPRGRARRGPALGPADPPPAATASHDPAALRAGAGRRVRRRGPRTRHARSGSRSSNAGSATEGGVGLVDAVRARPADPPCRRARGRDPTTCPTRCATCRPRGSTRSPHPPSTGSTITFRADAATVAALVGKGAADAAILLPPVTVEQIRGRRARRSAHAAEDDVLRAEAAQRPRLPAARLARGTRTGRAIFPMPQGYSDPPGPDRIGQIRRVRRPGMTQ